MRSDYLAVRLLAAVAIHCCATSASAQAPAPEKAKPLVMAYAAKSVSDVQVIGGKHVSGVVWPATFLFFDAKNRRCTATAVGERAVLTAAHCVDNGQAASLKVAGQVSPVDLVCDHHPDYAKDASADFALCLASRPLQMDPTRYEVIDLSPSYIKKGSPVTLLGFGCLTTAGVDANVLLYEGQAQISSTNTSNWVVTVGAGVCFGDSGGGAYSVSDSEDRPRRLIGVNSRGNISNESWLSPTSSKVFETWARKWRETEEIKICGVQVAAGTENCHQ